MGETTGLSSEGAGGGGEAGDAARPAQYKDVWKLLAAR